MKIIWRRALLLKCLITSVLHHRPMPLPLGRLTWDLHPNLVSTVYHCDDRFPFSIHRWTFSSNSEFGRVFWKRPVSKCFRLCRWRITSLLHLFHSDAVAQSGHRQRVHEWAWLCFHSSSLVDTELWISYNFHTSPKNPPFEFFNQLKVQKTILRSQTTRLQYLVHGLEFEGLLHGDTVTK